LFDFPHLSSFNACEELNHLIILYPLSPALISIGRDIVSPNYYGGAALGTDRELCSTVLGVVIPWEGECLHERVNKTILT